MSTNYIKAVPMTFLASSSIGAYQPINQGGLPESCFLLKINNFTSTFVVISLDGITDHDTINFGQAAEIYGGQGSSQPNGNNCMWKKGQVIYVRGTAGTGVLSLAGYYQPKGV